MFFHVKKRVGKLISLCLLLGLNNRHVKLMSEDVFAMAYEYHACVGEIRNAYNILVEKSEGSRWLRI